VETFVKKFVIPAGLVLAASIALAPLAVAQASTEVTVTDANLHGFSFTETRATGHYEFKTGGLHIWTEAATSTDKVAAYMPVDAPLADVAARSFDPSLKFNAKDSSLPAVPGYQLQVTRADGKSFILVGEPVYGANWWAASCAGYCGNLNVAASTGGGSAYSTTLENWVLADPATKVTGIGFSMGSGVHGDGVLKSMEFNGTTFRFAAAVPDTSVPPTSTVVAPTTTPAAPTSTTPPLPTILPVPVPDTNSPQVDVIPSAIDTGRA
jgi:hypothetical protein